MFVYLQWDLFQLNQMETFEAMLNRLYKQELEKIVMSYENYRMALNCEIERRKEMGAGGEDENRKTPSSTATQVQRSNSSASKSQTGSKQSSETNGLFEADQGTIYENETILKRYLQQQQEHNLQERLKQLQEQQYLQQQQHQQLQPHVQAALSPSHEHLQYPSMLLKQHYLNHQLQLQRQQQLQQQQQQYQQLLQQKHYQQLLYQQQQQQQAQALTQPQYVVSHPSILMSQQAISPQQNTQAITGQQLVTGQPQVFSPQLLAVTSSLQQQQLVAAAGANPHTPSQGHLSQYQGQAVQVQGQSVQQGQSVLPLPGQPQLVSSQQVQLPTQQQQQLTAEQQRLIAQNIETKV